MWALTPTDCPKISDAIGVSVARPFVPRALRCAAAGTGVALLALAESEFDGSAFVDPPPEHATSDALEATISKLSAFLNARLGVNTSCLLGRKALQRAMHALGLSECAESVRSDFKPIPVKIEKRHIKRATA
jgi:hypothetical protein